MDELIPVGQSQNRKSTVNDDGLLHEDLWNCQEIAVGEGWGRHNT